MFLTSKSEPAVADRGSDTARPSRSVAARITLGYAAAAFVLLMAVAATLDWALETTLDSETEELAEREWTEVAEIVRNTPDDLGEIREEILRGATATAGIRLWIRVRDLEGRSLVEAPHMSADGLVSTLFPSPSASAQDWGDGRPAMLPSGRRVQTFSALVGPPGVGPTRDTRVIEIGVDLSTTRRILRHFREQLALVTLAGFVGLLLVGYAVARRGLKPLGDIASTMQRIGSTTLHERVNRSGLPKDLWVLATAFNEVLERLDASFLRLAQFSADIAHELRTPLVRMRLATEVALQRGGEGGRRDEALGECLEEAVKLSRLIDRLLFLARAEGPDSLPRGDVVDLGATVETAAEFYRAPAEEAQIRLTVNAPPGLAARVDRELLLQAIGNLIQNALAYTPSGGEVHIDAVSDDEFAVITVRDSGCGIPADHVPRLFDAFHRVDRARSSASGGTGLGLAIVKKIARLHGGDVVVTSEVGVGTVVTLTVRCEVMPATAEASVRADAAAHEAFVTQASWSGHAGEPFSRG